MNTSTEKPTKAKAKLTIDQSEEKWPGLLITYAAEPHGMGFSDVAALLFGLGLLGLGAYMIFLGLWELGNDGGWGVLFGAIPLLIGLVYVRYMLAYRAKLHSGLKIQYGVNVADGVASFEHDGDTVDLELSKIGRMWLSRESLNGMERSVDIAAYYDGNEITVFNVMGISRLLEDVGVLVPHIVDYLNGKRDGVGEIQAGYCSDYAADTPVAARQIKKLAPFGRRMALSAGVALFLLMFYFSPHHAIFNRITSIIDIGAPLIKVAVAAFFAPMVYGIAAKKADSCTCRYNADRAVYLWPLVAALAGWLLQFVLNAIGEKTGVWFPDVLVVAAIVMVMTWIVYHSFGRCSCGAYPERV